MVASLAASSFRLRTKWATKVCVLDPDPHSPAGLIADEHLVAAYDDYAALDRMAGNCAAVTTEFENVPRRNARLPRQVLPVRQVRAPSRCARTARRKTFLARQWHAAWSFAVIPATMTCAEANAGLSPAVLKLSRALATTARGRRGWQTVPKRCMRFTSSGRACVLEKDASLDYEVSVVLARDRAAGSPVLPRGEQPPSRHPRRDHRPGRASACQRRFGPGNRAERIADKLWATWAPSASSFSSAVANCSGTKMAPRPHNSGHHTIDASSQRNTSSRCARCAVWPLTGEPRAALGRSNGGICLASALVQDGKGHGAYREPTGRCCAVTRPASLYGKHHARPGPGMMGHFVVTGTMPPVLERALARAAIGIPGLNRPKPPGPDGRRILTPAASPGCCPAASGQARRHPYRDSPRPRRRRSDPGGEEIFAARGRPDRIADRPSTGCRATADLGEQHPQEAIASARAFWPGPLTADPEAREVPDIVTGGQDTVGLRRAIRSRSNCCAPSGRASPHRRQTTSPSAPDHRRPCARRTGRTGEHGSRRRP